MTNFTEIREALAHYRWFNDTVDIALVYYIFYRLLLLIKGTRAFQMLIGIGLIVLVLIASQAFEFYTLDWLIHSFWSQIVLAVVILFQPEIRRTLARVGERHLFRSLSTVEGSKFIEETVKAAVSMANKRIGALIVLERDTDLTTIVEMGTDLDAKVTKEILDQHLPALLADPRRGRHHQERKNRRCRLFPAAHAFLEPLQGARYAPPRRCRTYGRGGRGRRRRFGRNGGDLRGQERGHRAQRRRARAQEDAVRYLHAAEEQETLDGPPENTIR